MRVLILCLCLLIAATGCRAETARRSLRRRTAEAEGPKSTRSELADLLRQIVFQSYAAAGEGFDEAYLEHVRRSPRLVVFGLGPEDAIVGFHRDALLAARPFAADVVNVVSKALEMRLSEDGMVAWVFDELSYRITVGDKRAFVPLRYTAVYQRSLRRGERWFLVMAHLSYGVRDEEALRAAAEGQSPVPAPIGTAQSLAPAAEELRALVLGVIEDEGPTARARVATDAGALMVGSDADRELRGDAITALPTVRALFGYDLSVRVTGLRAELSDSGNNGWAAATLRVEGTRDDRRLVLGVRATWVLEKAKDGWRVVQTHVSVPVDEERLLGIVSDG